MENLRTDVLQTPVHISHMCVCLHFEFLVFIILSAVNLIENANMNLEQIILLFLTFEKYEISALKLQATNCVKKIIELQRNSFT